MINIIKALGIFLIFTIIDIGIWLLPKTGFWISLISKIRNSKTFDLDLFYIIPDYILMTIALYTLAYSPLSAFILGLTIYGVFDFTFKTMFPEYPNKMLIMDMLWGGILFTIMFYIKELL